MSEAMDAVVARAGAGLQSLEDALDQLSSARARVTHGSGLVSVEVDQHGGMCGLWLPESLDGVDARDLGRAIVETAGRAAGLVAQRREAILASLARALTD
ncbi:YbaB/EbfC family DNA-binding protein [Rhodococcus sp. NPDC003322]